MGGIDTHWLWLGLAALLGLAELAAPGVFLFWIAIAAALTGVLAFAVDLPLAFEAVIFALFSIGTVQWGRTVYARNPVRSSDPLLNDRLSRLIGDTAVLETAIVDGKGRAVVGDSVWPVHGPDLPQGTRVRIVGAGDGYLKIVAAEAGNPNTPTV